MKERIQPFTKREQGLVDLMFDICLSMKDRPDWVEKANYENICIWVAKTLRSCGYPTQPIGSSWGVLYVPTVEEEEEGFRISIVEAERPE